MREEFNFKECPTQGFISPYIILTLHKLGGSAEPKKVIRELKRLFDLGDEISDKTFGERVHFARWNLVITGYIGNLIYGLWQLTEKGRQAIKDIESRETEDLENFRTKNAKELTEIQKKAEESAKATALATFEDGDIEDNFAKDLGKIRKLDPFAFERLCARVLQAYGYEDVDITKKSKDGGIDGVGFISINLVRLKVVFQAKRYANNNKIGTATIDALAGSKQGERGEKAILITTSDFTKDARKRALKLGIDLINGNKLMLLMYEKEIGYKKTLDDEFLKNL